MYQENLTVAHHQLDELGHVHHKNKKSGRKDLGIFLQIFCNARSAKFRCAFEGDTKIKIFIATCKNKKCVC